MYEKNNTTVGVAGNFYSHLFDQTNHICKMRTLPTSQGYEENLMRSHVCSMEPSPDM